MVQLQKVWWWYLNSLWRYRANTIDKGNIESWFRRHAVTSSLHQHENYFLEMICDTIPMFDVKRRYVKYSKLWCPDDLSNGNRKWNLNVPGRHPVKHKLWQYLFPRCAIKNDGVMAISKFDFLFDLMTSLFDLWHTKHLVFSLSQGIYMDKAWCWLVKWCALYLDNKFTEGQTERQTAIQTDGQTRCQTNILAKIENAGK